jgi:small subunit ribosomal protein S6
MYELTYIISLISANDDTSSVAEKVRAKIKGLDGEAKKEYISEKKRLAYLIKKQGSGFYATVVFEMEPEKIDELNAFLRLNNNILRYIIINQAELRTEKISRKPARTKVATSEISPAETTVKTGKVKIEELDKKLEELLK